ncbi:MAG: hypothetical protein P9L99_08290 [Candidatus Lernaella stagnicola]|nr:hypothetical protein [Candidatus Lernaella stagnicola]
MKRIAMILLLAIFLVTGCAYYQKQAMPEKLYTAADMKAEGLQRDEFFTQTRYGFRLLTIPINVPEPNRMIAALIDERQARGVTNLEVEFSEFNVLLFSIPKIRVTGHLVK